MILQKCDSNTSTSDPISHDLSPGSPDRVRGRRPVNALTDLAVLSQQGDSSCRRREFRYRAYIGQGSACKGTAAVAPATPVAGKRRLAPGGRIVPVHRGSVQQVPTTT